MATTWQQNYQLYKRYVRNLALMYQKRQDLRAFVELLLSLSAITIFGLFAIRPTIITIIDLNNQITEKRNTLSQLNAKITALDEAQEALNRNRPSLELVENAIPSSPFPELYLRQIEGLANKHSLLILDVNTGGIQILGSSAPAEETSKDPTENVDTFPSPAKSFEFGFTLLGNYQSIHSFLRDFESLRRPMYQDSLNIRLAQGEIPGELALSVTGRIAYLPNEQ